MSTNVNPGGKCPSGGTWYACATGTFFVGCCSRDPCSVTCPSGDLYPAGFDATAFSKFPDASCGSGVSFYTCTEGNTFLGCCKSNPCANGTVCPRSDLEPSFLNRDDLRIAYGAISASPNSTIVSSTVSASTSTSSATATATATSIPVQKDGPPVAAIAGGAAGGASALVLIIGAVIYYIRHAKKSRKGHDGSVSAGPSNLAAMATTRDQENNFGAMSPPPGYASPKPHQYYDVRAGQYLSYQHNQAYTSEPQELDDRPRSPINFSRKPDGHQRNFSELSGDTAIRSELESPHSTLKMSRPSATLIVSPLSQEHNYSAGMSDRPVMNSWAPVHDWQMSPRSELPYSPTPTQDLGIQRRE